MFEISVEKERLLSTLRSNLEKHVAEFNEADANYAGVVIQKLRERADEIEAGAEVNLGFNLPKPTSYERQYKDAIEMLEWETEDTVTLDHQQFKQYIQDEWQWSGTFAATTSNYR